MNCFAVCKIIIALFIFTPVCCSEDFLLQEDLLQKRYKRKNPQDKIKICVVVHHFGKHQGIANNILNMIPPSFALSISPYFKIPNDVMDKVKFLKHSLLFIQPVGGFEEKESFQDPYRLNIYYDVARNRSIFENTIKQAPAEMVAMCADQGSLVFKDEQVVEALLEFLKEKKLPFFMPEMALNHDFHKICQKHCIPFFEADYFIKDDMDYDMVSKLLEQAKDLAEKTGLLILAVEEQFFNTKMVVDWLQKMPQTEMQLIGFEELVNG